MKSGINRDTVINGLLISLSLIIIILWGVRAASGQDMAFTVNTSKTTVINVLVEKSPIKLTGTLSLTKPMVILAGAKTLIRAIVITEEPIMHTVADTLGVENEVESGAFYERIFDCEQVSILKGITTLTPVYGKVVEYPTDKIRFYVIDRGGAK